MRDIQKALIAAGVVFVASLAIVIALRSLNDNLDLPSTTLPIQHSQRPQPATSQHTEPEPGTVEAAQDQATILVSRVIDGDTIELETGEKVRYIGIDTPETKHPTKPVEEMGQEASQRNKELVEGQQVRLENDVSETDRYGRLLRYVYVGDTFVNELLVKEGYANAVSYPPDVKHQDQLRQAEQYARDNKLGLWGETVETTEPETAPAADTQPVTEPATAVKSSTTTSINCSSNTYNCSDFTTCSEAMAVFNACLTDIHRIDGNDDGVPCEILCQ